MKGSARKVVALELETLEQVLASSDPKILTRWDPAKPLSGVQAWVRALLSGPRLMLASGFWTFIVLMVAGFFYSLTLGFIDDHNTARGAWMVILSLVSLLFLGDFFSELPARVRRFHQRLFGREVFLALLGAARTWVGGETPVDWAEEDEARWLILIHGPEGVILGCDFNLRRRRFHIKLEGLSPQRVQDFRMHPMWGWRRSPCDTLLTSGDTITLRGVLLSTSDVHALATVLGALLRSCVRCRNAATSSIRSTPPGRRSIACAAIAFICATRAAPSSRSRTRSRLISTRPSAAA